MQPGNSPEAQSTPLQEVILSPTIVDEVKRRVSQLDAVSKDSFSDLFLAQPDWHPPLVDVPVRHADGETPVNEDEEKAIFEYLQDIGIIAFSKTKGTNTFAVPNPDVPKPKPKKDKPKGIIPPIVERTPAQRALLASKSALIGAGLTWKHRGRTVATPFIVPNKRQTEARKRQEKADEAKTWEKFKQDQETWRKRRETTIVFEYEEVERQAQWAHTLGAAALLKNGRNNNNQAEVRAAAIANVDSVYYPAFQPDAIRELAQDIRARVDQKRRAGMGFEEASVEAQNEAINKAVGPNAPQSVRELLLRSQLEVRNPPTRNQTGGGSGHQGGGGARGAQKPSKK